VIWLRGKEKDRRKEEERERGGTHGASKRKPVTHGCGNGVEGIRGRKRKE